MNHAHRTAPLAVLLALTVGACQSADKGERTGKNITLAADQIERGIGELEATVAALHTLTENPTGDLNAQRKSFENALETLESTAEDVSETAADMKAEGKAYFQEWDQQLATIQNEDIRERSADRRKAIESNFSELEGEYTEAKNAFQPLLSDLRDIRTALQADLTVGGLDALKSIVKKVDKQASSVSKELKDLVESFRELGLDLSRAGSAPAPEKK